MMKRLLLSILLLILLATSSCQSEQYRAKRLHRKRIQQAHSALEVAIEANIKYREITTSCGWFSPGLATRFLVIPLRKDIIRPAVAYKAAKDSLKPSEEEALLARTENEFLEKRGTFILIIISNSSSSLTSGTHSLSFKDFKNDLTLINESGKKFKMTSYTHNLDANLNPGFNMGYINFDNFRSGHDGHIDTYTLFFRNFRMSCNDSSSLAPTWSFLFEDSEVRFLALVREGWSKQELREDFVATPYERIGLSTSDVLAIVKFVLNFI